MRFADSDRHALAAALTSLKEKRFGTWRALAEALQIPQGTIHAVCAGKAGSMAMVYHVAMFAGASVEAILAGRIVAIAAESVVARGAPRFATHDLKTWPKYFAAVLAGDKPFEIRRNDRGFRPGDLVRLREWDPATEKYTGRVLVRPVTYVTDAADIDAKDERVIHPAYVVFGLGEVSGGQAALLGEVADLLRDAAEKDETTYWPRSWLARALAAIKALHELGTGKAARR